MKLTEFVTACFVGVMLWVGIVCAILLTKQAWLAIFH